MATRSNIIIKKNGHKTIQLYNHYDSYPSGLGKDLAKYFISLPDATQRTILKQTPTALAKRLKEALGIEIEWYHLFLHGDIEYLYVIDLDEEEIFCYEVDCWHKIGQEDAFINGKAEDEKLVYNVCLWQDWEDMIESMKNNGF